MRVTDAIASATPAGDVNKLDDIRKFDDSIAKLTAECSRLAAGRAHLGGAGPLSPRDHAMSGPAKDMAQRKNGFVLKLAAETILPKASHDELARQRLRRDLQQLLQRGFAR